LYEGFGIPAIEAQKGGLPVIASRIPIYEEILGKSALLINPLNSDELVNAFKTVQNDAVAQKLIKAGFKNAAKFTWAKTAHSILKCFYDAKNS
ncbi:MAG TPA: glycosyltransferase, partial [Candidatus Woesebacteria bacterium]|nr:glycosyltransferase [Candidatus Woesebacteria bacterium]